jgi:hypothetical protein
MCCYSLLGQAGMLSGPAQAAVYQIHARCHRLAFLTIGYWNKLFVTAGSIERCQANFPLCHWLSSDAVPLCWGPTALVDLPLTR